MTALAVAVALIAPFGQWFDQAKTKMPIEPVRLVQDDCSRWYPGGLGGCAEQQLRVVHVNPNLARWGAPPDMIRHIFLHEVGHVVEWWRVGPWERRWFAAFSGRRWDAELFATVWARCAQSWRGRRLLCGRVARMTVRGMS